MEWVRSQLGKGLNPRTYVLVGLLVGVLVWIQSLDSKQRSLRAGNVAGAPGAMAMPLAAPARKAGPSDSTPDGWGRDPFDPRFRGASAAPAGGGAQGARIRSSAPVGLYLQGIMAGPRGRTALINGDVVREGDRIGSREVLQIGARSVLIMDQGQVHTLTLRGDGS